MEDIVREFNETAITFIKAISKICPHSLIMQNIDLVERVLDKMDYDPDLKELKELFIVQFAYNVLEYKQQIDNYDETFFMSSHFADEVHNKAKTNNPQLSILDIVDKIKDVWGTLTPENKNNVFEYMQVLCYYAQEYLCMIPDDKLEPMLNRFENLVKKLINKGI